MNKYMLSVMIAGLLAMASCTKEVAVKPAGQKQAQPSTARMAGANYSFNKSEECINDGANCHAYNGPIIITPKMNDALTDAEAGGKVRVGEVFRSPEFGELCAEMAVDLEMMLQSGDYFIARNYESNTVVNYMLGREQPVTAENMVTAFQFRK
jgi:hypothetical protein